MNSVENSTTPGMQDQSEIDSFAERIGLLQSGVQTKIRSSETRFETKRQDLLGRFTPTPHATNIGVMGRTVGLESNRLAVVESALRFFVRYPYSPTANPEFLWRIVSEKENGIRQVGVELSAFSDDGVRWANMGQRSFLAVDLKACVGIGFLADGLVESEPKFHCRSVFDTLFCMSAAGLGLVSLSAACVGVGEKGILICGPPNSGKTVTSYLAARLGLEFHADQASFLEIHNVGLRAWGDLLPAIFRPEALQFLPELRDVTRQFSYPGLTVHYLSKRPFQAATAHPIAPVCCVFLDRVAVSKERLVRISPEEFIQRLAPTVLFQEDARFEELRAQVFDLLVELPAYHLTYGGDPAIAATLIKGLLTN